MLSAGAVSVPGLDDEPLAQNTALGVNGQVGCPPHQIAGQQKLDPLMFQTLVWRQVLPVCVGVDRHLGGLASADRCYEVESDHAALALCQLESSVRHMYLHTTTLLRLALQVGDSRRQRGYQQHICTIVDL